MINKPIYLDYAATTPLDPRVALAMQTCLTADDLFGNSASLHFYGRQALDAIECARLQVANTIHAETGEIIFTSGATESNNLALKGAARLYQAKGRHIVTMQTEHKAVLDTCQHLAKEGFAVTYLSTEPNGLLDLDKFIAALRPDTILTAIMQVNNETGVIQNVHEIAHLTAARGILCFVDAAQSIGKIPLNVQDIPVDLISLSAHKVYGPKGIGALYIRRRPRVRVAPLLHGGGHEYGMRSGTLATHQIVGMSEAYQLVRKEFEEENKRIHLLRDLFWRTLQTIPNCKMTTSAPTVPHIINLQFERMFADAILAQLPQIAASTASACALKGATGSYVLRAMGFNVAAIQSAIRFSFGRFTTEAEIIEANNLIKNLFD